MSKMIVYQMMPRLWGNDKESPVRNGSLAENGTGKFSDIDVPFLRYIKALGVSHLWLTGVIRHATRPSFDGCPGSASQIVKGKAGSPYAIVDYYDVNPYLAGNPKDRMAEFESTVKRIHYAGLEVLIDLVPNHLSRDYGKVGLSRTDVEPFGRADDCSVHWKPENDFYYYPGQELRLASPLEPGEDPYYENPAKASGNCFTSSPGIDDWYDTVRLNYCPFRTETWDKMLDVVRFWCRKGVDGFRCDMVEMVPKEFLKWLIGRIKREFPSVKFIAEAYGKKNYSLYSEEVGFDLLYDKSGFYDSVRSIMGNKGSARCLTWNWQSIGEMQPKMIDFLENHDEQRFASDYFGRDVNRSFAALGSGLFFSTSSFLLYFGEEIGERGMDEEGFSGCDGRTSIFDWWSVESLSRLKKHIHTGSGLNAKELAALERYSKALNMAASIPAVSEGGSFDLCYCNLSSPGFNPDKHFSFLRGFGGSIYLFFCNFSDEDSHIRLEIPAEAFEFFGEGDTKDLHPPKQIEVNVKMYDCSVIRIC